MVLKQPQQGQNSLFYYRIGIYLARRNHFPEKFSQRRKQVAEVDGSPHFVTIVQILILLIDKINIITDRHTILTLAILQN